MLSFYLAMMDYAKALHNETGSEEMYKEYLYYREKVKEYEARTAQTNL